MTFRRNQILGINFNNDLIRSHVHLRLDLWLQNVKYSINAGKPDNTAATMEAAMERIDTTIVAINLNFVLKKIIFKCFIFNVLIENVSQRSSPFTGGRNA